MTDWLAQPAGRDDPVLKVRLSPRDYGRIEGLASGLGIAPSRLLREIAVRYGGRVAVEIRAGVPPLPLESAAHTAAARLPPSSPPPPDESAVGEEWISLPAFLAQATGESVPAMERLIRLGQVTVDGIVWRDTQVDAARLARGVAVAGRPV